MLTRDDLYGGKYVPPMGEDAGWYEDPTFVYPAHCLTFVYPAHCFGDTGGESILPGTSNGKQITLIADLEDLFFDSNDILYNTDGGNSRMETIINSIHENTKKLSQAIIDIMKNKQAKEYIVNNEVRLWNIEMDLSQIVVLVVL